MSRGDCCPFPKAFICSRLLKFWPFSGATFSVGPAKREWRWKSCCLVVNAKAKKDDETLAGFVRRRLGREALERMAQPMIGGIYTADPEQLSLRATMPRFLELETGAPQRNSRLAPSGRPSGRASARAARVTASSSSDRGMQLLTDKLAEQISSSQIRLNTSVKSLRLTTESPRWAIQTESRNHQRRRYLSRAAGLHQRAITKRDR